MGRHKMDEQTKRKISEYYNIALDRIKNIHIDCFEGLDKPVFLISDTYPGIWLEHVYDSLIFAKMEKDYLFAAKNTLNLFIDNQLASGQLPCYVIDKKRGPNWQRCGYSQIQECVSFASLCYEYFEESGDTEFLNKAYEACRRWVEWYKQNRMKGESGMVEMYCGYDTGHDNSPRMTGMTYKGIARDGNAENYPVGDKVLPVLAPDVNAVYYGNLVALSKMARVLGKKKEELGYINEADLIKSLMLERLYDSEDEFFYDTDKNGSRRKYLSISITNVLAEHLPDMDMAKRIIERHILNPEEFYTKYPFPSIAKSDPAFSQNTSGNSWGFYSQALTILRCTRWMDYYGYGDVFDEVLEKWVYQWTFCNDLMFGQELDPITGENSDCSEWYSSCMLVYIYAVRRLKIID